ncbi:uncharacterized protein G2W53_031799 [Senna tora]|uniref:Uncharacterized protein n=1 Tax=Senna tora TaxID=362788 RepID=A0A834SWE3_9FABA|nr:uncharacterized protein G2W53_031799 [Senna tora]
MTIDVLETGAGPNICTESKKVETYKEFRRGGSLRYSSFGEIIEEFGVSDEEVIWKSSECDQKFRKPFVAETKRDQI